MKNITIFAAIAIALGGCSFHSPFASEQKPAQQVVIQKVDKQDIANVLKKEKLIYESPDAGESTFTGIGEGIAPLNTVSPAQALALAKRAAMADAYRDLAAKLYGVKINAKDTVKDAMLQNSSVTSQVNGLVKNAAVVDESFTDGLYKVKLELKISTDKWKEIFSY